MVREWSFSIIFILTSCFLFSQEGKDNFKRKGLSFQTQPLILFHYNKNGYEKISPYITDFELKYHSFLYGINGELNYYFNSHLGTGLGFGYEKLSQPNIIYYPLYVNIIGMLSKTKRTVYSKFNFGIHLGDVD